MTIEKAIEKIFTGIKERSKPVLASDGFDSKSVRYNDVQELPSGLVRVRRVVEDIHGEIGQRRTDIISYNPSTGENGVLLQDATYVPKVMSAYVEGSRGEQQYGTLNNVVFLTETLAAGITVALPKDIREWPNVSKYASWSLLPSVPSRASLVFYDVVKNRKREVDLTELLVSQLGEADDQHMIYGNYFILTEKQAEEAKDFLKNLLTSGRSSCDKNPLYAQKNSIVKELPPVAIRSANAVRYDAEHTVLSVYVRNYNSGFSHHEQIIRLNVQLDEKSDVGYKTSVGTGIPIPYASLTPQEVLPGVGITKEAI